ncbi:nucleoside diphosphate kinase 6 isoform X1 [Apteryx mantelli]|uniref:Nucleoside diphosphate kinase n=1 Tax=Apteryx mantelli TaxID=2696672 RepID=A0ABM4G983_9AVES
MMAAAGRAVRPLQLTLALLKPDAVAHPLVLEVSAGAARPGAGVPGGPRRRRPPSTAPLPAGRARDHPQQPFPHRARQGAPLRAGGQPPLLPGARGAILLPAAGGVHGQVPAKPAAVLGVRRELASFCSGPMWAYILAHENAILLWRSLMGPTKVFRARNSMPDSIRGAYGLTDTRNTTHGSDSPASASREIAFFFPEFNEQLWYQQDEPRLRCGQVYYNAKERVHCVFGDEETELA